jgi:hypothetical protein
MLDVGKSKIVICSKNWPKNNIYNSKDCGAPKEHATQLQ